MPLKSVEPISIHDEKAICGIIKSRGIHFVNGLMTEDALLGFIYDSSKIYNLNTGFYRRYLIDIQKPGFKVSEIFIAKVHRMLTRNERPLFSKISNSLSLSDFNHDFSYEKNVRFLSDSSDSTVIREFVLLYKPKIVGVDAETCAVYKLPKNRSYDYIAFAFDYEHVFLWFRPKKRYLNGLFKFMNDLNVTVLHWGPGDEHYFVPNQKHMDLQAQHNGSLLSLSNAAFIVTGRYLDKGLTMGIWSTTPYEMFMFYREFFDYLILDVLILLLIKKDYDSK